MKQYGEFTILNQLMFSKYIPMSFSLLFILFMLTSINIVKYTMSI